MNLRARRRYPHEEFMNEIANVAEEAAAELERQGDRDAARRLRGEARNWKPATRAELDAELDAADDRGLLARLLGL
jgi:hypothetical protein